MRYQRELDILRECVDIRLTKSQRWVLVCSGNDSPMEKIMETWPLTYATFEDAEISREKYIRNVWREAMERARGRV